MQLLRALAGVERATGTASCDGAEVDTSSPLGALRAGIVLLSGERVRESLFPVLERARNATIQVLRRLRTRSASCSRAARAPGVDDARASD